MDGPQPGARKDAIVDMNIQFTQPVTISASVSCMDLLHLQRDIRAVEQSAVRFFHFDVVDGVFNTCLILGLPTFTALRGETWLPIEVHLATYKPGSFIEQFAREGANYIAVHYEATPYPDRILEQIRALGAIPVLAYRAETPPGEDFIRLARQVPWVLKLTVHPGFSGQTMQPNALSHIRMMRQRIEQEGLSTRIQADGNICPATIQQVVAAGADILTGGTSGLFRKPKPVVENAREMLECARWT